MPKKKAVVDPPASLNVTRSRRAASKEALKQLQKLTEESAAYDSPETLEIVSDEDEVYLNTVRKYNVNIYASKCCRWLQLMFRREKSIGLVTGNHLMEMVRVLVSLLNILF